MTNDESQLVEVVARIIDVRRSQVRINPSWIATEALKEIDPDSRSRPLVRVGCHLHLRQIARGQCRKLFGSHDGGGVDDQGEMFEELQWRYPTARSKEEDEPQYVLRQHMSSDDIAYNVARLRSEARAKLAHADALEAWGKTRGAA